MSPNFLLSSRNNRSLSDKTSGRSGPSRIVPLPIISTEYTVIVKYLKKHACMKQDL